MIAARQAVRWSWLPLFAAGLIGVAGGDPLWLPGDGTAREAGGDKIETVDRAKSGPSEATSLHAVLIQHQIIQSVTPADEAIPGRAEAILYCQTCHIFAEPDLLDRATLRNFVLPFLTERLGIPAGTTSLPANPIGRQKDPKALAVVNRAGIYPAYPLVPPDAWKKIVDYYLQAAPEVPLPRANEPFIRAELPHFKVFKPRYRTPFPFTTLVEIDTLRGWVYAGDSADNSLVILDGQGRELQKIPSTPSPVAIEDRAGEVWIASIGSVFPSDNPRGKLVAFGKDEQGLLNIPPRDVLTGLSRPTFATYGDLNGDGRDDIVMSTLTATGLWTS